MTALRIGCCIPGCGRTFRAEAGDGPDTETMCGRHWRMADTILRDRCKRARARHRRVLRLVERLNHRGRGKGTADRVLLRSWEASHRTWQAVVVDATIKAAFGAEDGPRRRPGRHEGVALGGLQGA